MKGIVIPPQILNQITILQDPLSQAYLMDCIIQLFPKKIHIDTIEVFISAFPKICEKVNIRTIVQSTMKRLKNTMTMLHSLRVRIPMA